MQIDSATPPSGFAQNDSIVVGVENSNGNERRIESFICGGNSNHLDLPLFSAYEDRLKGEFSIISHHIER